jgi:hypothetical protein
MIYLSPNGSTLYRSDRLSQRMIVGSVRGVVGREREAGDWRVTGRILEEIYISALMVIPEEGLLFASAHHA